MVELKTKVTKTGVLYIPLPIREAFGREMRIIPNASAAVFFAETTPYEDVLSSLKIIAADLRHRINMRKGRAKA
jgi:hypothetical protein